MMRVCIGSLGRFHTFDLARQMERAGHLRRVYTGYPKWKFAGLLPEKVKTFPWLMGPAILLGRWGFHDLERRLGWPVIRSFDHWMAGRLDACDIFHCLSGTGL